MCDNNEGDAMKTVLLSHDRTQIRQGRTSGLRQIVDWFLTTFQSVNLAVSCCFLPAQRRNAMFPQKNHSYTVIQLSFVTGEKAWVLAARIERRLRFELFAGNDFGWRRDFVLATRGSAVHRLISKHRRNSNQGACSWMQTVKIHEWQQIRHGTS